MMERTKPAREVVYIGIDPGSSSGGIAAILPEEIITFRFKNMTKKELCDQFRLLSNNNCKVVLEKVHTMPGQGISSAGKFMENYGMIQGFLMTLDMPFKMVTPQAWMKYYGMKKNPNETKSDWKKRLRQRAQELYPLIKITAETGDAVLIAEYCRNNW